MWEAGEDEEGSGRYRLRNDEYHDPKTWPSWKPELNTSIKMKAQHLVKRASKTSGGFSHCCDEKTWPTLLHQGEAYFTKCSAPEYSSPWLGGHVSKSGHLASTIGEQRSKVVLSPVSLCTLSWIKTHGTGPSQRRSTSADQARKCPHRQVQPCF